MLRLLILLLACCLSRPLPTHANFKVPAFSNVCPTVCALAFSYGQPKCSFNIPTTEGQLSKNDLFSDPVLKRRAKWAKWLGIGSLLGLIIPGVNLLSLPAAIASLVIGGQVKRQTIKQQYLKDVDKGTLAATVTIVFLAAITVVTLLIVAVFSRTVR